MNLFVNSEILLYNKVYTTKKLYKIKTIRIIFCSKKRD
jgi:hypothetical protein